MYQREGDEIRVEFQRFDATLGYPVPLFYLRLAEICPHAKVILSIRDGKEWVNSCGATMLSPDILEQLFRAVN